MIRKKDSLAYHSQDRAGKIEVRPTKPCLTPREVRLAYLPGAVFASEEIARDPSQAFNYTSRGNLVGVITNGSAAPGLGNVGPHAVKPIQEGMALLFKRLADIDVFDLELNTDDPVRFIETVQILEPTFGGINLNGICAPEGLDIYDRLNESLNIPVFHENLYSSAVVAAAALLNALDLAEKTIEEVKVVICGAGTVGIGCARLLLKLGITPENLFVYDVDGLIHPSRKDILDYQRVFVRESEARDLASGLRGADVFLGASAGGVLSQEMIRSMGSYPIVLALASPEPEINYEAARASRRDVIVATSLGQYPNAVLDLLSFPYIFRGALDVQATSITEGMLVAAAHALAELAREDALDEVEKAYGDEHFSFGPEYLLPKPIDPRIFVRESAAVAEQAIKEGVARQVVQKEPYQESLTIRFGTGRETLRELMMKARQGNPRLVFSNGSSETILKACGILLDEKIARPILLGREKEIRKVISHLGVDLRGIQIIDPYESPQLEHYIDQYYQMRRRRGVMRLDAEKRMRRLDYFGAMMLHAGDADMLIAGEATHYPESVRPIIEIIGPAPGISRISSHHLILQSENVYIVADCAVNIDPSAQELAEIALLAATRAHSLGLEPRVAMLSFSNYGGVNHPFTQKVRRATEIAKKHAPDLLIDGEIQLRTAVNAELRQESFPFTGLSSNANVFVFPDLQSGNLALNLLEQMGDAIAVGPLCMGTRLSAHAPRFGGAVEDIVNLAAVGAAEAVALQKGD